MNGIFLVMRLLGTLIPWGLMLFYYIAKWKVYVKAGEAGWKCLIPLYSQYTYMKIAWKEEMFWVPLGLAAIPNILAFFVPGNAALTIPFYIILALATIAGFVIYVIANVHLAHRFGKGTAFGICLLTLLPIVGIAILGYDADEYHHEGYVETWEEAPQMLTTYVPTEEVPSEEKGI